MVDVVDEDVDVIDEVDDEVGSDTAAEPVGPDSGAADLDSVAGTSPSWSPAPRHQSLQSIVTSATPADETPRAWKAAWACSASACVAK